MKFSFSSAIFYHLILHSGNPVVPCSVCKSYFLYFIQKVKVSFQLLQSLMQMQEGILPPETGNRDFSLAGDR
jgi:hypothetical protein